MSAKTYAALFVLVFSLHFSTEAQAQTLGKIDADVAINFAAETVAVSMKYDYVATEENESVIKFYLNKAFDVKTVRCRLCQSFNFDHQAEPRPSLLINLTEPLAKGKRLLIEIEYSGSLNGIYNRDHKFLELGLDNFWYPAHKNTSEFNFLYRVSVKTDQPNFHSLAMDEVREKPEAGWLNREYLILTSIWCWVMV